MANEEHLAQLQQGVATWNQWREKFPEIHPDLHGVGLTSKQLNGVNLAKADLTGANLAQAALIEANLFRANLTGANLREADLAEVDLSNAVMGWTILGDVDLSLVLGLETVRHAGPSTIGVDTLYHSQGNIPEVFLRGAGVPEDFIP
jgi:hypothetical protein